MSRVISCLLLAGVALGGQPDAWKLYPPNVGPGSFEVPVDNMQFGAVGSIELRYMGYDSFAIDKASPVLLYLGNEGQIESFYNASGFLFELAQELEATVMFIEHRYYGESLPFGKVESFSNEGLRYLTIEQVRHYEERSDELGMRRFRSL